MINKIYVSLAKVAKLDQVSLLNSIDRVERLINKRYKRLHTRPQIQVSYNKITVCFLSISTDTIPSDKRKYCSSRCYTKGFYDITDNIYEK